MRDEFKNIKLVVIDVDGTLTDGTYQINCLGMIAKTFHTRDFWAIEQLLRSGRKILILTQSHDDVMMAQLRRIGGHSQVWDEAIRGGDLTLLHSVDDKKQALQSFCLEKDVSVSSEVLYIGDAENDVEAMKICALTACPADAIDEVQGESNCISGYVSGKGAMYDIYNYFAAEDD